METTSDPLGWNEEKQVKVFKILILGDSGTGKTCLVRRSVHAFFTEGYRSTIGVDFSLKVLPWSEDLQIRLQMWDLAGQDRFSHLSRLYFSKAVGALLVCDQGNQHSLEGMVRWKKELDSKVNLTGGLSIPTVILANKEDLRSGENNSQEDLEMEELARDLGASSWTRTSAKTGSGVEEGIRSLIWQILDREQIGARELERTDSVIRLPVEEQTKKNSDCQCW
eukprot:GFUD01045350.1.p1 GENE.GFUD01045350.1~~GFUD01045350.1.p1  ORF type:complete len:223 (+),score=66.55 GFUD01045350.1:141-809(+)